LMKLRRTKKTVPFLGHPVYTHNGYQKSEHEHYDTKLYLFIFF